MTQWALIYFVSLAPISGEVFGHFTSYEKCHAHAVWQEKGSDSFDTWACVKIGKAIKEQMNEQATKGK